VWTRTKGQDLDKSEIRRLALVKMSDQPILPNSHFQDLFDENLGSDDISPYCWNDNHLEIPSCDNLLMTLGLFYVQKEHNVGRD